MPTPLVLVTGFGPFGDVMENPSDPVARGLVRSPPEGIEIVAEVLPVSFARAPEILGAKLEGLGGRKPDLLLGLGVHRKPGYRVELRARAELTKRGRPDVDGVSAIDAYTPAGEDLRTGLEPVIEAYVRDRDAFFLSEEAGGYVCERIYRDQLERGQELQCAALFVHVPYLEHASLERQVADLGELILHALSF